MSRPAMVALAALGVPRAIVHDLDLLRPGLDFVLAVLPMAAWLLAASRSPEPFRASLVIGGAYGLMLALTHQALWDEAFDEESPRLGDNLADGPAWVHAAVTRAAAFVSSLATGALVGGLVGAGAALVRRIAPSLPPGSR